MGLISWMDSRIKKLVIWDWGFFKWALVLFGVIIGAYISDFVKEYLWYFIIVTILCYGYFMYRFLTR